MKYVVVLNQFALPRTEGGGTRHIDLFSRVTNWTPLIVTGARNHYTQKIFHTDDTRFRTLPVPAQSGTALGRLYGWVVYSAAAFVTTLCRRHLDLVYASSPQPFAPLAGLIAARLRRVPFILEVRDLWPESAVAAGEVKEDSVVHRIFRALERLVAKQAYSIVCVTDGWEAHFEGLGVPSQKICVIPNGTELSDFEVSQHREVLRTRYAITGFTAIFAGSHGLKDGIGLILDAATRLTHINFVLIGAGSAKQSAMDRVECEQLRNVTFLDPVAKDSLAELLRACDVGVHCVAKLSVFERGMSPNKLFDYMAAGLPIVSNARVPIERITQNGECGLIGDTSDLTDCLRGVSEASPEQLSNWSMASKFLVKSRFSRSASARKLEQVLDLARLGTRRQSRIKKDVPQ